MVNASRDENRATTLLATLSTDGATTVPLYADSSTHELYTHNNSSGSDLGDGNANRDDNHITSVLAVSSADGVTPVPVYANSDNRLLTSTV